MSYILWESVNYYISGMAHASWMLVQVAVFRPFHWPFSTPRYIFNLVDSINKKLTVAREIAGAIGLENISIRHCRGRRGKFLI